MSLNVLDLATVPALALLCVVTSVEDIREGRIRNKWIVLGLCWGAAVYGLLTLSRVFAPQITEQPLSNTLFLGSWPRLLLMTAQNALAALGAGFLLFHFGYWSAGDAKLFFAITALLPLQYYFRHYLPVFPAFNLFVNTLTVSALYVWGEALWGLAKLVRANPEKDIMKEIIDASVVRLWGALRLLLVAAVLFSAVMCVNSYLRLSPRVAIAVNLSAMIWLLLAGNSVNKALEDRSFQLRLGAVSAVFFTALLLSSLRLQFLRMAVFMTAFFSVAYFLMGIIPGVSEKYKTQSEHMPFAIWLALGLLATMLIKGSLLYLLLV